MKKGYSAGMISLYDIGNVAMLYEPSNPRKVSDEFMEIINKTSEQEAFHQYCNNLKFLLRISQSIISNKQEDAYFAVRMYLLEFINNNFDFDYSYNWQELKSILFYCNYMSNLKSFDDFAVKLQSRFFAYGLCSYFINDNAIPERKLMVQKLQGIDNLDDERKIAGLVYKLYKSTNEEVNVVENSLSK